MAGTKTKPINLALQGGGAHGAFTWGVLDYLLEDGRLDIKALTATSAGAMNAVVFSYGFHNGGPEGAREKLESFWWNVSRIKEPFGALNTHFFDQIPFFHQIEQWMQMMILEMTSLTASPYQLNPLGLNPLKDVLTREIDFDEIHSCDLIKLFISATNVQTGKVKIFTQDCLTADKVMASACLPQIYQAVEIDGEFFWDGGYMGNPSLWPLFYETDVEDVLVVHINPITREKVPHSASEIANRINEITFNSALLKEMRAVAFVQKLTEEGWLNDDHVGQLSDIRFHSIRAEHVFEPLSMGSKYDTGWDFLTSLRDQGRLEAEKWINANYGSIGKKSTVDLRAEFLDV
ncbi:patatin-like phospholipase family protein [Parvularcula sp. LCG005]|uniref:patatin-like phospholipase family protein n=1 Tax=Parvularcula sp. LCG005 TaxID=3078805 RepID=UPI002942B525|nr:patatin-like phospholipase family protein [Parvularcula sp. LCG005]WOI54736.1 patatin-like phospholipase family protein [Parvularcula sp. LCG005]